VEKLGQPPKAAEESEMKIAAVQMISGPDVAPNLATAGRLIAEAAAAGARLVALPEYFPLIGASDADRLAAREAEGSGPIQDFLADAARSTASGWSAARFRCWRGTPASCATAAWCSTRRATRVARYDKIHLFGFRKGAEAYDEAATIERGDQVVAFDCAASAVLASHLLRPALSPSCSAPWANATCWCCPPPSPKPPAAPTGKCCCAPAPSRTSAMCWPRPRAAAPQRTHDPRQQHGHRPLGRGAGAHGQGRRRGVAELDPQRMADTAPACRP
jgi:predicted amidohydrolase